MAIGRTFKEALQKGLRSLEIGRYGLGADGKDQFPFPAEIESESLRSNLHEEIRKKLSTPNCRKDLLHPVCLSSGDEGSTRSTN